jgi:glutamate dehydrogenase (NADP+)
MAQNSQRLIWTSSEVDIKLKDIMAECYKVRLSLISFIATSSTLLQQCLDAGSKWSGEDSVSSDVLPSLLSGANVAGFIKVADAMKAHGDWW